LDVIKLNYSIIKAAQFTYTQKKLNFTVTTYPVLQTFSEENHNVPIFQ